MFQSAKDYLQKKAQELDLGRGEDLGIIQSYLDLLYPDSTRALSLNNNILRIITPAASIASDLRLRQTTILEELNKATKNKITALHIKIGTINRKS